MTFTITLDGIMYTIAIIAICCVLFSAFLKFIGVGDN